MIKTQGISSIDISGRGVDCHMVKEEKLYCPRSGSAGESSTVGLTVVAVITAASQCPFRALKLGDWKHCHMYWHQ